MSRHSIAALVSNTSGETAINIDLINPTIVAPAKERHPGPRSGTGAQSEHVSRPTVGISLFVLDTGLRRYDELLNGMEFPRTVVRSEEHTSELQSRGHLVCRLLLEKKT